MVIIEHLRLLKLKKSVYACIYLYTSVIDVSVCVLVDVHVWMCAFYVCIFSLLCIYISLNLLLLLLFEPESFLKNQVNDECI